jgi:hypothetical protein
MSTVTLGPGGEPTLPADVLRRIGNRKALNSSDRRR